MRLVSEMFEKEVVVEERPLCIYISDAHYYAKITELFYDAALKKSDKLFLFDKKGNELATDKNIITVLSPYLFDFDSKSIISKVFSIAEENLNSDTSKRQSAEEAYSNFVKLFSEVCEIYDSNFDIDMDFDFKKISKMLSLRLHTETIVSLFDKIIFIAEICTQLKICSVLVFVGLKNYFDDKEISQIYKMAMYNNLNIVTLEKGDAPSPLSNEKIIWIDEDYYWQELELK